MEDIVTQRVNEFREVKKLSVTALAKVLNVGQTTLNKQLKEDGYGVSLSTILLILEAYPNLSAEWLLRGKGSMDGSDKLKTEQFIPVQNNDLVEQLKDHITTLKENNTLLKEKIRFLDAKKKTAESGHIFIVADNSIDKTLTNS